MTKVKFDHCVIQVSDWERCNAFYRDVLGAELIRQNNGWAYRFGDTAAQLPRAWRGPDSGCAAARTARQQRFVLRVAGTDP